jgi:site-specific DNA-methyltransferase (adenine-specific)
LRHNPTRRKTGDEMTSNSEFSDGFEQAEAPAEQPQTEQSESSRVAHVTETLLPAEPPGSGEGLVQTEGTRRAQALIAEQIRKQSFTNEPTPEPQAAEGGDFQIHHRGNYFYVLRGEDEISRFNTHTSASWFVDVMQGQSPLHAERDRLQDACSRQSAQIASMGATIDKLAAEVEELKAGLISSGDAMASKLFTAGELRNAARAVVYAIAGNMEAAHKCRDACYAEQTPPASVSADVAERDAENLATSTRPRISIRRKGAKGRMQPYYSHGGITIYHGDCREILPDLNIMADVVLADPPYGETSLSWDRWPMGWIKSFTGGEVAAVNASFWCFGSFRMFLERKAEFEDWRFIQDVVWEKHNGSGFFADRFRRVHETAAHFIRSGVKWSDVFKSPQFTMDATARTVRKKAKPAQWQGATGATIYTSQDGGPRLQRSVQRVRSRHGKALHPTEKPIAILSPLLLYSCPPNGIVLDPVCGSGCRQRAWQEGCWDRSVRRIL